MEYKQAIIIRTDLKMGKGKIASQAAHASIASFLKNEKDKNNKWLAQGMRKIVLKVKTEEELLDIYKKALELGFASALIRDAGKTQIEEAYTAVAIGPDEEQKIDKITKDLKLL